MVGDNLNLALKLKGEWDRGVTRRPFVIGPDERLRLEKEAGDPRYPHLFTIITGYKRYLAKYTAIGKGRLARFTETWSMLNSYKKIPAPELEQMKQYMLLELKDKARQLGWKVNADIEIPSYKELQKAKKVTVTVKTGKYSAKANLLDAIKTAYPPTKTWAQTLTKVNLLLDPTIGFGAKEPAQAICSNWGKNIFYNFDWLTSATLKEAAGTTLKHEIIHSLHQQRKIGRTTGVPYQEDMSENLAFYLSGEPLRAETFAKIVGMTIEKAVKLLQAWIKYKEAGRTSPVAREWASYDVLGKTWQEFRGKKKTIPTGKEVVPASPIITPAPAPVVIPPTEFNYFSWWRKPDGTLVRGNGYTEQSSKKYWGNKGYTFIVGRYCSYPPQPGAAAAPAPAPAVVAPSAPAIAPPDKTSQKAPTSGYYLAPKGTKLQHKDGDISISDGSTSYNMSKWKIIGWA